MADNNGNGIWRSMALVLATGFVTFVATMTYVRIGTPPTYTKSELDLKFQNLEYKIDQVLRSVEKDASNAK